MRTFRTMSVASVALVCILGAGTYKSTDTQTLGARISLVSLPGRHLQVPWWEAVVFTPPTPAGTSTYSVPADVLFATASSSVDSQGVGVLIGLAPELRGAISVTVAGCTDAVGGVDSPYNVALGMQRALAAVAVLEAARVPALILHPVSWADTHPVTSTAGLDQSTVNALSRRIVLIVTK